MTKRCIVCDRDVEIPNDGKTMCFNIMQTAMVIRDVRGNGEGDYIKKQQTSYVCETCHEKHEIVRALTGALPWRIRK